MIVCVYKIEEICHQIFNWFEIWFLRVKFVNEVRKFQSNKLYYKIFLK